MLNIFVYRFIALTLHNQYNRFHTSLNFEF